MKYHAVFLAGVLLSVGFSLAPAQELVHENPFQIEYDTPNTPGTGVPVFNGREQVVFYGYSGADDNDQNLYFRRLASDGAPQGPQLRVYAYEGLEAALAAVWDGSAYIVVIYRKDHPLSLARISSDGKGLVRKELPEWAESPAAGEDGQSSPTQAPSVAVNYTINSFDYFFLNVLGDDLTFCFSAGRNNTSMSTYMLRCDRSLSGTFTLQVLPKGGLPNSHLLGMTLDTERFLLMFGQRGNDNDIKAVRLLQVGFDGEVIGTPYELEQEISPARSTAGPVFIGNDSFIVFYTHRQGSTNYNTSIKIDADGNTLYGPNDLGDIITAFYWSDPIWQGSQVAVVITDTGRKALKAGIFNAYAHNVVNPIYFADQVLACAANARQTFTGMATTILFRTATTQDYKVHLLSNQISLPASITKPKVAFFAAGDAEPQANHRVVIWSVAGCTSVLIRGRGVKMKRLPPVGAALVEIKSKKLKLTLLARGPGGKAKEKIVIRN